MEKAMEIITSIRTIRSDMKVPTAKRPALRLAADTQTALQLKGMERSILSLAGLASIEFLPQDAPAPKGAVSAICEAGVVYLPLGELVDIAQEIARAEKESATLQRDIGSLQGKLGNEGFLAKAPAQVVETERQRLIVMQDKLQKLQARIDGLKELD